jgi:hypothetical protein
VIRLAAIVGLITGISPCALRAAAPEIRNLDVRGLQIGRTTTLTIDGEELGTAPRLLLPFASKQTLKSGATAKRAIVDVTLDDKVEPGYYNLRVATTEGISLPVLIGVDRLPQLPLAAAIDRLPGAFHGNVTGSTVVSTKFTGKAGEKILVEVEARRLGSGLRPIVHLYDAKNKQLTWAWGKAAFLGDARLQATLPTSGAYSITVHDVEYAGASPGFFRLKIGQWSYVDRVFPAVVGKDQKAVELTGSLSTQVDLPVLRTGTLPLSWPKTGNWSGPRPYVQVSRHPEFTSLGGGKVQTLPGGKFGVSGRLVKPFSQDRFRIPVRPGDKVRLELFADRLGSSLEPTLVIRNELGTELARAEEGPNSLDPVINFTVPSNVTAIVVGILDAQGHGGLRAYYRLSVQPVQLQSDNSQFELFTHVQRINIPVGGRSVFPVWINRQGYQGLIELSAKGMPGGVKQEGASIPADADGALVTLHRGAAGDGATFTYWKGRGKDGQEQALIVKGTPGEQVQPWLASELPLATIKAKAADFQVDWRGLAAESGLVPGKKLVLPVKVNRPAANTIVRLSLLTSQKPVLVNGQANPGVLLRLDKPAELASKLTDSDLPIIVPPDLPGSVYDLAVQADLLSPDRRTILATAYTPVRRFPVRLPLMVHLEGPPRIEAKQNPKTAANIKIKGKIERREGAAADVTLTLAGLPPGIAAAPVVVKSGSTDFILQLIIPPNIAPGETTIKILGSIAPDPTQPAIRVRSRDVELTLALQANSK